MTDIAYAQVWADHVVSVGEPGETVTVTVLSGDTVYYGDPAVTSTSNFGSLTVGQSASLTNPATWLRSASQSYVQVTGQVTSTGGSGVSPQHLDVFGHSLSYGAGPPQITNGYVQKFARLIGAPDMSNWSVGGAILCHGNTGSANQGDGGIGTVLQTSNAFKTGGTAPYLPVTSLGILHYGENDIPTLGSNNPGPLIEALRATLSRMCLANLWEDTVAQWTYTGAGWTTTAAAGPYASGSNLHLDSTVGDFARFTVPADWETGKVLALGVAVNNADSYTVQVKQNGTVIQTVVISGATMADPNGTANKAFNAKVIRLNVPGDGITINPGDTIDLVLSAFTAGAMRVDYAQIEASDTEGPLIAVVLPHTLANLTGSSVYASYQFGPTAGTNPLTNAGILAVKALIVTMLAEFGNHVVPVDLEGTFGSTTPTLFADTVHPNGRASALIAALILSTLQQSRLMTPARMSSLIGLPQLAFKKVGGAINGFGVDNAGFLSFGANCTAGSVTPSWRWNHRREVKFQGAINCSTFASLPATLASGIPVGVRPQTTHTFLCPCVTNATPATVTVDSAGNVKCTANGDTTGIYLDPIAYLGDD